MNGALTDKRILVVARATTHHARAGGMETAGSALVTALQRAGATTSLLTTAPGHGPLPDGLDGHTSIWAVDTRRPGRYSIDWWRAARWRGPWADWRPNLILSEGDAAASFAGGCDGVPLVVHAHGTTILEALGALRSRTLGGYARASINLARTPHRMRLLKRASCIIAVGNNVEVALRAWPYLVSPSVITTLNNSVDPIQFRFSPQARTQVRRALGARPDERVYLSVGRLAADKGVDTVIRAFAKTKNPRARLVVAGDGEDQGRLRQLVAATGVSASVTFLGRVSRAELPGLLSASDQLLFATRRSEGSPMVVLEAAASGLPIVVTPEASVPSDFVAPHVSLVDGSVRSVAAAMEAAVPNGGDRIPYLPAGFSTETLPARAVAAFTYAALATLPETPTKDG